VIAIAVESPASFAQSVTYSAEQLRHVFGTLLQRGSGIGSVVGGLVSSGDMLVTAGTGMQVLVAPGEAWITGNSVSTQGAYYARVTSSNALAISAANATNPRIETIIAQVKDAAYAGTEVTFSVSVVVGTAEAGSTLANLKGAGAVPASSLVLAYCLVPAKAVSLEAADIENVAVTVATIQPLVPVSRTGSFTAVSGQFNYCNSTCTATLASPATADQVVEIFAGPGATVTVKTPTSNIYGDFITGAAEVTLLPLQHLRLESFTGSWFITAGEPKREGEWTAGGEFTSGVAFEPSSQRPSIVSVEYAVTGGGSEKITMGQCKITVGGQTVGTLNGVSNGVNTESVTFSGIYVPAGAKVVATLTGTVSAPLKWRYILL
jgi:hypothetical protein